MRSLNSPPRRGPRSRRPLRSVVIFATLTTLAILVGCKTPTTVETAEPACAIFVPISYDGGADTPDTIAEVREHNAVWDSVCNKDEPE